MCDIYFPAHRKPNRDDETSGTTEEEAGRVVYVGHIPHGFYEEALKGFFGQFGGLKQCRLSRSKRSARSKGYAFLEFEDSATACIVAEAMDGYFIYDKQLVCGIVPPGNVHPSMFKGCDKRFKVIDWHTKHRDEFNQPRNEHQHVKKLLKSEAKKRRKLAAMGIEYVFTGFKEEIAEMKGKQEGRQQPRRRRGRQQQQEENDTCNINIDTEESQTRVEKKKKRGQEQLKKTAATRQEERPKKQSKSLNTSTSKNGREDSSQQQEERPKKQSKSLNTSTSKNGREDSSQQRPVEKKKHRKGVSSPTGSSLTRTTTRSCSARNKKKVSSD